MLKESKPLNYSSEKVLNLKEGYDKDKFGSIKNYKILGYKRGDGEKKNVLNAAELLIWFVNEIHRKYPEELNTFISKDNKYFKKKIDGVSRPKSYKGLGDGLYFNTNYSVQDKLIFIFELCNVAKIDPATVSIYYIDEDRSDDRSNDVDDETDDEFEKSATELSELSCNVRNLLISGVPGSGKSYFVNTRLVKALNAEGRVIRTIFHPEYTNSDFIGQLRPYISKGRKDDDSEEQEGTVTYKFFPGPFTLALVRAFKEIDTETIRPQYLPVALIIEELNRGDCAAIFGEVFQLLDRGKDGSSEYAISAPLVTKHLADERCKNPRTNEEFKENDDLFIPSNLFLISTMNTSDQNIFPLDTAFNRRWRFIRYPNEFPVESDSIEDYFIPGFKMTWGNFIEKVNKIIVDPENMVQNCEDKQLGVFFVDRSMLCKHSCMNRNYNLAKKADPEEDMRLINDFLSDPGYSFAYKVLGYLWNDVSRTRRSIFFNSEYKTLEDVVRAFVEGVENLFVFTLPTAKETESDIIRTGGIEEDNADRDGQGTQ